MVEFIKYCLYCLGIAVSGSMGYNPEGMSLETIIIGVITWFVLVLLASGILWLISFIVSIFND